jgi:hypothetical protein
MYENAEHVRVLNIANTPVNTPFEYYSESDMSEEESIQLDDHEEYLAYIDEHPEFPLEPRPYIEMNYQVDYENTSELDLEDVPIVISSEMYRNIPEKSGSKETDCSICGECLENQVIKNLKCKHEFHVECLKTHLTCYNVRCPMCRLDLRE